MTNRAPTAALSIAVALAVVVSLLGATAPPTRAAAPGPGTMPVTAVGAAPSAMPGPEVPQALQSGVLDAGLTDLSAAVSRRFYEFQRFGTVAPYFSVISHVYVNPRWWNGLTAAQRAAIEAAARKAEADQMTVTEETAASAAGELRARGMTIHEQTAAETETWRAAMQQPVVDAFLRIAPDGGARMLELLRGIPAA